MEAKTDTTSTTSVAYKLNFYTRQQRLDLAPGEDLDYDAWLVEFPNSGSVYFSIPPLPGHNIYYPIGGGKQGSFPERVEFMADHDELRALDYPHTDKFGWPVMSRRMLYTLRSVREFRHRAYPIVMLDAAC